MEDQLTQGLTFLAWSGAAFLIVTGIFLAKLLFDLSRLTVSLKKSSDIIKTELDPIMKNISETTTTVNRLVQSTDKKVGKITEVYDKVSEATINAVTKISTVSGTVLKEVFKGLYAGVKRFISKKVAF